MKKKLLLTVLIAMTLLTGCYSTEKSKVVKENTSLSQTHEKKYKIGIIKYIDQISLDQAKEGFIDEMNKNGIDAEYIEQSENGDITLTTTVPENMKQNDVDLVYAIATPAAQGAKNIIKNRPIIFSAVTDPVGAGLVDTVKNPGSNITGVSDYVDSKKQVKDFLTIYPEIKTLGVIYNTSEQNSLVQIEKLKSNMDSLGIKVESVGINNVNDIPQAMTSLTRKSDALFALTDNMVASAAPIVSDILIKNNTPSISAEEGQVKNGLLMSEGVNYYEHGAQAARMAIKVLKGEKTENMPVEYNEKNIKKVNEKTAKALKLDLNLDIFKDAEIIK